MTGEVSSPEHQNGWPDVVMALIDFARATPYTFMAVMTFIIILVLAAAYVVWLLLPRFISTKADAFRHMRQAAQQKLAESQKKLGHGG